MIEITYFQSNIEELIDKIQELGFTYDGIILNAGAYTHTSIAIGDAIKAITTPVIEVHISFIRVKVSDINLTFQEMQKVILGFGLQSYELAIRSFCKKKY
jgi:3-dehydroquinate dehydratase-2